MSKQCESCGLINALQELHRVALGMEMEGINESQLRAFVVGKTGAALRDWQAAHTHTITVMRNGRPATQAELQAAVHGTPMPVDAMPAPHGCRLVIERNLAPANMWHWAVLTPTGHVYAVSKTSHYYKESCLEHAREYGLSALDQAEADSTRAISEPRAPAGRMEPAQPAPARADQ